MVATGTAVERVGGTERAKWLFVGLVAVLLALAVGHLYLLGGLTTTSLGVPLWLWVQLVVFAVMLAVAWLAVRLRALAVSGGA